VSPGLGSYKVLFGLADARHELAEARRNNFDRIMDEKPRRHAAWCSRPVEFSGALPLAVRPSVLVTCSCQSRVMTMTLKSVSSFMSYWPSLHFASSTS
jgi:hypothetical protein